MAHPRQPCKLSRAEAGEVCKDLSGDPGPRRDELGRCRLLPQRALTICLSYVK